jgi:LCP family protein required for cell wall assembly
VSTACVALYAAWDVASSIKPGVKLVDSAGNEAPPHIGAIDGSFNVLLAGSDSGGGDSAYGVRDASLNDVTMLLHVSADHRNATVVSFPRDMFVAVPSCPNDKGGNYSAMSRVKINTSLSYGGLACTVLTVSALTGLDIPYAGVIEFDGVIEMSNAVGGVPVCVTGDIYDKYTGLDIKAGELTLEGTQALAFLRSRHSVGDGSDLGRISSQQAFLSSLVRTLRSAKVLSDPIKVYGLAKAATRNIQLSESLADPSTIVSMALAVKDIDLDKVVFVQFPNHVVDGGVAPTDSAAKVLLNALAQDQSVTVTGDTGIGTELDPNAPASLLPSSALSSPPTAPPSSGTQVALPNDVHGQSASQTTCTKPFSD